MAEKRILFITHAYHNRGGVEEHLKSLIASLESLTPKYHCYVGVPEGEKLLLIKNGKEIESYPISPLDVVAPLTSESHEGAFEEILKQVEPDLIHLMHPLYWPISIVAKIANLPIPSVISFHDFYPHTPHFTMEGRDDVENFCTKEYSEMLLGRDLSEYLRARREIFLHSMNLFSARVSPSHFLVRYLKRTFPGEYLVIPCGIPDRKYRKKTVGEELRFGFIGSLVPQKGCEYLLQAFKKLLEEFPKTELHIHGGTKDLPESSENIIFHGPYEQKDLKKVLNTFDIGVIPSIFPETYSLVLSEMWQAKKPICASNIGAIGERILDEVNGKKFIPKNVDSIYTALKWFIESDKWREFEYPTPYSVADMTNDFHTLYSSLIGSSAEKVSHG